MAEFKIKIRHTHKHTHIYVSIQFSSVAQSCPTLCDPMNRSMQASLSITNSRSLLRLMFIELVMPSNHLIFCRPLRLLPSILPSIRVFSSGSALHITWLKYWSFSFNISPSNEHPGLISFRMDWLDLLAVQGTLKSLLQHHSSGCSDGKASAGNAGDLGLIPGLGRSRGGEGMATDSSILAWRIPMDRGVWRTSVHGATKSWT